ncbi:MAG: hypothetical protein ACXWMU_02570, partial [Candidatus Limnocylindrales bacterium]
LKGRRVGGAVVSEKHANFIVNDGHATAADVRTLGELVRADVRRRWAVELVYEVLFLGDWSAWETDAAAAEAVAPGASAAEAAGASGATRAVDPPARGGA